jgi:hypothetical protein
MRSRFVFLALLGAFALVVAGCGSKNYVQPPIISHAKTLADRQHFPPPIEPVHFEFKKSGKGEISYLEPECRSLVMLFEGFAPGERIDILYNIRAIHAHEQEAFDNSFYEIADEHGSKLHIIHFMLPHQNGGYFFVTFFAHGEKVHVKLPWGNEVWNVCTTPKSPEEKNPRAGQVS